MIEIRIPQTLRKMGYRPDKSILLRRTALMRSVNVAGRDETLFNMSTLVMGSKEIQAPTYHTFKNDFDFLISIAKVKRG
jgi:hypothetical protein